MAPRVQITLDNSTLELAPGEVAEVQVVLTNLSGVVDSFVMSVAGLDPSWYAFTGDQVGVFPGQSSQIALRVHPPVDSAALAGNYTFSVIATSVDNPTEQSSADLVLQLSAAGGIVLGLEPQRASGRKGLYNIVLQNSANRPLNLVLSATDPEEALRYIFGTPDIRGRELAAV